MRKQSIKEEIEISKLYDLILTELAKEYSKYNTEKIPKKYEVSELNLTTLQIAEIISEVYLLSNKLVISDFRFEIARLKSKNYSLNDIPTYNIRFSIEEGSWIILLRNKFPLITQKIFDRLFLLEDTIYESGKGITEDFAYYILEINELAKNYLHNLFSRWKNDHIGGNTREIAIRIIGSIYQVQFDQAETLLEGGLRVLQSKMSDLLQLKEIEAFSHRITHAKNILEKLEKSIRNDDLQDEYYGFVTILTLFQKQIIEHQQKKKQRKLEKYQTDKSHSEISNLLGWDNFDPDDTESIEEIRETLINLLFEQPDADPLDAARNLLKRILVGLNVRKNRIEEIIFSFVKSILSRTEHLDDEIEKTAKVVELIQMILPTTIIRLKQDTSAFKRHTIEIEEMKGLEMWDCFEDNIRRARRNADIQQGIQIILKSMQSIVSDLSAKRIPFTEIVVLSVDQIIIRFPKYSEKLKQYKIEVLVDMEEYLLSDRLYKTPDTKILEKIASRILQILRTKK